jgi:3-deoxy-7-phosphoheptulonate synthase
MSGSHGNTISTPKGVKTRSVDTILDEIKKTHKTHRQNHSHLGGLHLEQTGEDVTECIDHGMTEEVDEELSPNYRSLCDPRLSRLQAMYVVKEFVQHVHQVEAAL